MAIVDVFVTTWSSEPYIGGAYSTLGVGATPADRLALAEVVGGRMTFAGEHLSAEHPATMHGAYNSGVAAALRLLKTQPLAKTAVVVGAGLSGLAAAQTLRSAGLSVQVLEASAFLGGRARTQRIWDDRAIHPGAAWVHGIVGNPIAELASLVHIEYPPEPSQTQHVSVAINHIAGSEPRFESAIALDPPRAELIEAATQQILDSLDRSSSAHRASGQADETVRPTLRSLLCEIGDQSVRDAVGVRVVQHFESLLAGSLDDISLHHGNEPYAYPGGDHYVTSPLEPMMNELTKGITMKFSKPVSEIRIFPSYVHIASAILSSAILSPVITDVVVVAVPLIPLQRDSITFVPPLPDDMRASLHRLRMGTKAKVFVRFDEKWWGNTQTIWVYPSVESQNTGALPGVSDNDSCDPTASPYWPEWVDATDVAGVPTLFGFVSGQQARRIEELATTAAGISHIRSEVESLFAAIQPTLSESRLSHVDAFNA